MFIEKFKEYVLLDSSFYSGVNSAVAELLTDFSNFEINLTSAYYCDVDISDVDFSDVDVKDIKFYITKIEGNEVLLVSELNVPITVCVSYETYIKDSVDGDFIVADNSTLDIDETVLVEIECVALIDATETDVNFELSDINVNITKKYIDVEIDSLFNSDDDDYDR